MNSLVVETVELVEDRGGGGGTEEDRKLPVPSFVPDDEHPISELIVISPALSVSPLLVSVASTCRMTLRRGAAGGSLMLDLFISDE